MVQPLPLIPSQPGPVARKLQRLQGLAQHHVLDTQPVVQKNPTLQRLIGFRV